MTRAHRRWHWYAWLVLAPLIAAGMFAALAGRGVPPVQPAPASADARARE